MDESLWDAGAMILTMETTKYDEKYPVPLQFIHHTSNKVWAVIETEFPR
jgi:hypothetical protein